MSLLISVLTMWTWFGKAVSDNVTWCPINDGNRRLTAPVKGREACDPLPEMTKIWMFKCGKNNSMTTMHVYKESSNFIMNYTVHFYFNGPSSFTEMVPVISIDGIMSCARVTYIRSYLTPGIWCLINSAFMETSMTFGAKIYTVML